MSAAAFPLTIGIPTRNRASMVAELVRVCLAQSTPALRVVVSDNASDDDTLARLEALAHPRLRVLRQAANIGMVGNWNACLSEAEGEWFLLLSDDDLVAPDFVEHVARAAQACDDADLLVMSCTVVNRLTGEVDPNPAPVGAGGVDFATQLFAPWMAQLLSLPLAGMVFRRKTLQSRGGFLDTLPYSADVATWLPIALHGRCGFWPEAKVSYIHHEGMMTVKYPLEVVTDDLIEKRKLLLDEIAALARPPEVRRRLARMVDRFVLNDIGHKFILSARRGSGKRDLWRSWSARRSRMPNWGLSPMMLGALLVPSGLIQAAGWPYRRWIAFTRERNAARARGTAS